MENLLLIILWLFRKRVPPVCALLPFAAALFAADLVPTRSEASNYQLSGSDVILVKVFQEPDLDSQHRISRDGTITLPLIGSVNVGGKTVAEAAALIRDRLAKGYLRNPQVRVNIIQYAPRRFSVLGQVQRPGSYPMGEETSTELLEAIAMAGGFAKSADMTKVTVRRRVAGEDQFFELNARALRKSTGKDSFAVQPGDTIIVAERLF